MASVPGISAFPASDQDLYEWVGTLAGPEATVRWLTSSLWFRTRLGLKLTRMALHFCPSTYSPTLDSLSRSPSRSLPTTPTLLVRRQTASLTAYSSRLGA